MQAIYEFLLMQALIGFQFVLHLTFSKLIKILPLLHLLLKAVEQQSDVPQVGRLPHARALHPSSLPHVRHN